MKTSSRDRYVHMLDEFAEVCASGDFSAYNKTEKPKYEGGDWFHMVRFFGKNERAFLDWYEKSGLFFTYKGQCYA